MGGSDNLADTLIEERRRRMALENQFSERGSVNIFQIFPRQFIKSKVKRVIVATRDYDLAANVLIWGHPTHGIWGDDNWGTTDDALEAAVTHYDSGDL